MKKPRRKLADVVRSNTSPGVGGEGTSSPSPPQPPTPPSLIDKYSRVMTLTTGSTGKPTKKTRQLLADMVELVRAGNFLTTVCGIVGLDRKELYDFLEQHPLYRAQMTRAEAQTEADMVKKFKDGDKGWQAHMAFLERRFRERWARSETKEVKGSVTFIVRTGIIRPGDKEMAPAIDITPRIDAG